MTSPLEDVVIKGKQHYYQGKSFRRWSLKMVHEHGSAVSPYLEEAWKVIEESAKLGQERNQNMLESDSDKSQSPKSAVLYRMVGPGRFAPVTRETAARRLAESVTACLAGLLNRKMIVALAATAFVLTGMFPPWILTVDVQSVHLQRNAGYAFIASPPPPDGSVPSEVLEPEVPGRLSRLGGIRLDTSRLLVEWSCILAVAGAGWFICGVSRPRDQNPGI